jgi:hypothetical protein
MFALTFGQQDIPPMAQKMSKKRQRLNYKHIVAASRDLVISVLPKEQELIPEY